MSFWGNPWGSPKKRGLRTWVVQSLHREPKNGAELITEMDRMTHGWWRPSPGSVYPLLEELVAEGVVQKRDDGRYELTARFRETANWTFGTAPRSVHETITELMGLTSFLEDLGRNDPSALFASRSELDALISRLQNLSK
jgi:DNA-binding PadR family transcriptional regulator